MIQISQPVIEEEEIKAVMDVLSSGMLVQGPKVAELEQAFAAYCGSKYAVAVNSGTAALHAALHALGIKEGDEVITTPFTFMATINAILAVGARPVLVDIDPNSFNIDIDKVAQAVTSKTKAVIPIDLFGQCYDFDELDQLAKKHGFKIVEDACQSIGAEYKGKKAGMLGDMGCFSLYATKNIMSGEGGVIVTDNEAYADAARRFRQHGMTGQYQYDGFGLNYRLSDLHAAIGVEQLKKVGHFTELRSRNAGLYDEGLRDLAGIVTPQRMESRSHVFHQYTVRITPEYTLSRDEIGAALLKSDVKTGIYYPKSLHFYEHVAALGYNKGDFPISEEAAQQVLSLPVHPKVTEGDVDHIIKLIRSL